MRKKREKRKRYEKSREVTDERMREGKKKT
jgi:hypothetical protein